MSVQIDTTNYEAFYLDYLEGNLSGEALTAFGAFLLAHPELSVEDPQMITLQPTDEAFDPIEKLALKQGIDLNDLTETTLPFFLIAREEGLLTTEQNAHLNHWLEANAHYRQDAELYALTTFEADTDLVYEHKEALKKPLGGGRIIPMWWTGVAVAAGLALLITIGLNVNTGTTGSQPAVVTASNHPKTGPEDTSGTATNNAQQQTAVPSNRGKNNRTNGTPKNNSTISPTNPTTHPEKLPKRRLNTYQRNNIMLQETVVASLEKRNASLNTGSKTVVPMPVIVEPVKPEASVPNDLAWVPVGEMKNPIQPVTSKIATTLNTPVDFRTAKATKRKGGGFYLKIGKLEVSHQSASL